MRQNPEPPDFSRGLQMFMKFHQLKPTAVGSFAASFQIPKSVQVVGEGAYIGYRSTKWENKSHDYHHDHEAGVFYGRTDTADGTNRLVPAFVREANTFVRLGHLIGLAYTGPDGVVEAKVTRPHPELYCIPSGRALLVIESKREVLLVAWGGHLDVTARGIVG